MAKFSLVQKMPRTIWVLGLVSLCTDTSTKMIQALLPIFLVSVLGASWVTVGWIEGIAEATASILKLFSGSFSDYWQRRKELAIAGYGLSALVNPIFALATSPVWVLAGRWGDRIGKGIRVAPRNALVADSATPEQRGAAYGLRQSLDTIGAFSGPLIALVLMAVFNENFRLVFWVATVPGLGAIALLIFGIQEPPSKRPPKPHPLCWSVLKTLPTQLGKPYWMLLLVALIFSLGNSSDAFLLLRAQDVGIAPAFIPLTMVVMNMVYGISAYPAGLLSDRLGRVGVLVTGLLLYAVVYIGFAIVPSPLFIWVLFGGYGLYLGLSQGALLALVADQVPTHLRGTAFGLINLVIGTALLPASLLAGGLWQWIGPAATFGVGSGFAVLGAIVLLGANLSSKQS
ncbi:MAG: MFS transporter [Cyanothece sp. SIO2G6]|nr:MFS transporter [Cyanothece sp. SIO2G6]